MQLRLITLISLTIICFALTGMAAGTPSERGYYFTVNQTVAVPGTVLQFIGSGPEDAVWNWDFGDGESFESSDPIHAYESPGSYNVTAAVSSGDRVTIIRQDRLVTVIAESRVIHVPGDAATIRAGIATAPDGTAVVVDGGGHDGPVVVDRPIALYGNTIEGESPVLYTGQEGTALVLSEPGSCAMGFAIEGAGESPAVLINAANASVSDLQVTGGSVGIMIKDAPGAIATTCSIENAGAGVLADSSPGTVIFGDEIKECQEDGISISNCAEVSVRSNIITGAKGAGIALNSAKFCTISENVIDGCGLAFNSVLGTGNTFWLNVISGGTGAPLIRGSADYWNATAPVNAMIGSRHTFGYSGNFWEGYRVTDADEDGFLDEPYWIDTANIDWHPLASAPVPVESETSPAATTAPRPAGTGAAETAATMTVTINTPEESPDVATMPPADKPPVSWLLPFSIAAVIALVAIVVYYTRIRHRNGSAEEGEDLSGEVKRAGRIEAPPPVRIGRSEVPVIPTKPLTATREAAEAEAKSLAASGNGREAAILLFREIVRLLDETQENNTAPSATPAEIGRKYQDMTYASLLKDFLNKYTTVRYRGIEPSDDDFKALSAAFHELSTAISAAGRA